MTTTPEQRLDSPGNTTPGALPLLVTGAATVVLAVYGWQLFYFLTDDAYISFRYVSNSVLGRGLVWNPAPFRPVEGYTSFLWVMVLREVWTFTGIAPPESSPVLSLLFGLGTLGLIARLALRMRLPEELARWRLPLLWLVLAGTLLNRTFLAWLSSGLETALFNFLFVWWVSVGTSRTGRERASWVLQLAVSAVLSALCRPDGMLMVGATVVMVLIEGRLSVRRLLAATPMLALPVHLLWRHATYGEWVPNTYYAKFAGAWPQAGARYFAAFVLEYGLWWWAALLAVWALRAFRPLELIRDADWWGRAIPIAVVLAHFAYYTFIIGGDHFEYRVYSHLIGPLFVSCAWLSAWLTRRGVAAAALVVGFILVSLPIPWTHWAVTKDLQGKKETHLLAKPIAGAFPALLRPIVAEWDSLQSWLIAHYICVRHQSHKITLLHLLEHLPSREEGEAVPWEEHSVTSFDTVGGPAWTLPNVAVIDYYGLNDAIIARAKPRARTSDDRRMAHDRTPPAGYVECFRPNMVFEGTAFRIIPRAQPLTDDDIRACETRDWNTPGRGAP